MIPFLISKPYKANYVRLQETPIMSLLPSFFPFYRLNSVRIKRILSVSVVLVLVRHVIIPLFSSCTRCIHLFPNCYNWARKERKKVKHYTFSRSEYALPQLYRQIGSIVWQVNLLSHIQEILKYHVSVEFPTGVALQYKSSIHYAILSLFPFTECHEYFVWKLPCI